MKKNTNKILIAACSLSLMLSLSACKPPAAQKMQGGLPVEAVVLEKVPVAQSDVYQAALISRRSVALQPRVAGQIADIFVKPGDHVAKGQPLMLIDNSQQLAAVNSSKADAAAAKSGITQSENILLNYEEQRKALESNLAMNKELYERYSALFEKKAVSQQDYEKYTDAYNQAKADLDANTAQINAQKSAVESARSGYKRALYNSNQQAVQLQYYKISAPFSGVVGDIPVKVGSYVLPTNQLVSVTENNPLEINVGLSTEKASNLKTGLTVEVLDNNDKVAAKTFLSFVSPNVDTDSQTVLVKAILQNTQGIFKADQSVKVRIIYSRSPGILVPASAVSHFGGQDFVYIITEKDKQTFVKQQPVKIGELQDDKFVVLEGLKAGDRIVSQGIQKLMDGAPVTVLGKGMK